MKRVLAAIAALAVAGAALYVFILRDTVLEPHVSLPPATATIETDTGAVAVGPGGRVLSWLVLPDEVRLPQLPLSEVPPGGRLAGPARQQARILGAAPAALRPYLLSSSYGEGGVDVELRSGIELRFGDASQLSRKWRAAAAVLADPSITTLDYVDLAAPRRPAVSGSGHTLPLTP